MIGARERLGALERYAAASERAAAQVIRSYSTSFGLATRMLGIRHRRHVRNIYALVRIADELVDGVAEEAGLAPAHQRCALDQLEQQTDEVMRLGYSSNPVLQAFARTARASGIGPDLTAPFFASMRMDLDSSSGGSAEAPAAPQRPLLRFGDQQHADYVHGSAEVVGLMCLRVFLREEHRSAEEHEALRHGACRLGAAFQNVNFLRDLADDTHRLGRSYLSDHGQIDAPAQGRWVATIRDQLADAAAVVPLLPRDARIAVSSALGLFSRLADRLALTPAAQLYERRIRVPGYQKAWILLCAAIAHRGGRSS